MKKLLVIIFFIIACKANAQYGDAYHAADQAALQRAANQRANVTSDEHYRNISSSNSSSSSSSYTNYDNAISNLEIFNKGYYAKVYQEQVQRRMEEAKAKAAQDAANEEYYKQKFREQQKNINNKNSWVQSQIPFYTSRGLTSNEAVDALEIQNSLSGGERSFQHQEYNDAVAALSNFNKEINSASFENLCEMIWKGKRFAETANACLDALKSKYPQKLDYLEQIEFSMIGYYFGQQEPFMVNYGNGFYPKALIEMMPNDKTQKIYERFFYFAKKFPSLALKFAGSYREHLNPFDAESWLGSTFTSNDKNFLFECQKNVLLTEHPRMYINSLDYKKWIAFYEKRLRNTINRLNNDHPDYIKNFTPTDWARIKKAQNVDYYYLWITFRKDMDKYENEYPALKKAMKGEGFDKGPQSGKGSIFVEIGDYYEGNFENGKPNGLGKYSFENGGNYVGNFKDGNFEGNGTISWANRNAYIGNFTNNKLNGLGKYFYANGQVYEGNFKNDKLFGEGILNYKDGGIYKGNFLDNIKTGKGTIKFTNGTSYEGDWKNDMYDGEGTFKLENGFYKKGTYKKGTEITVKYFNKQNIEIPFEAYNGITKDGFGVKTYSDGETYEGNYENYKMNGLGKYSDKNGAIYIGNFKDDTYFGVGTMTYANGTVYEGNWMNNLYDGNGTITYSNGNSYKGQFVKDFMEGQGIYTYKSGAEYTGEFKHNEYDGRGIFKYSKGTIYEGDFKNSKCNGQGTIKWANGESYAGEWIDDKQNGKGIYTKANGNYSKGTFKNDLPEKVKYYNKNNIEIPSYEYNK